MSDELEKISNSKDQIPPLLPQMSDHQATQYN